MSDTPIDEDLDSRKSTRMGDALTERVTAFKEEYNAAVEEMPVEDEVAETFALDSESEARRRLLDLALGWWAELDDLGALPTGFAFDATNHRDEDEELVCPNCLESDAMKFRLAASTRGDAVEFDTLYCTACRQAVGAPDRARQKASPLSLK